MNDNLQRISGIYSGMESLENKILDLEHVLLGAGTTGAEMSYLQSLLNQCHDVNAELLTIKASVSELQASLEKGGE